MLTNQLRTIAETLDLLKKVEIMEASEGFQKLHCQPQEQNPIASGQTQRTGNNDRRAETHKNVRQIQYSPNSNRNNGNWSRNRNGNDRSMDYNNAGSNRLNPNAPSFQGNQEEAQHSEN
jgi:hypothetical protein